MESFNGVIGGNTKMDENEKLNEINAEYKVSIYRRKRMRRINATYCTLVRKYILSINKQKY